MKELAAQISALAPEAGNALRVIDYFDGLVKYGAGINAIVRGAAALSGHTAVLVDREGAQCIAFGPDGAAVAVATAIPESWFQIASRDGSLRLGLESDPVDNDTLDALILERALLAASTHLGRPLDAAPQDTSSWVRLLVDENADADDRRRALSHLRLDESSPVCVAVVLSGDPIIATSTADLVERVGERRAGIGPMVPGREAARSYARATLALRLTADGTSDDPGDRVVRADDAGVLLDVVDRFVSSREPLDDVAALERAGAQAPWVYETLEGLTRSNSLREAAKHLHVHHSTLDERLNRLEKILGWTITTPQGRFRSQLALSLRRVRRFEV